jgi:hypothetical protein
MSDLAYIIIPTLDDAAPNTSLLLFGCPEMNAEQG